MSAAAATFVRFRTGGGEYAVAVDHVQAVRTAHGMLPLPSAAPHVVGVLPHGEGALTVIAPLGTGRDHVLVLDVGDGPFGLHVEEVSGVTSLPDGAVAPPPPGQAGDIVTGVVRRGPSLVLLVDAVALGRTFHRSNTSQ